jgi:hypothetical protein
MAPLPTRLIGEERRREIASAVSDWRKLTAADGEATLWRAAPRYWNETHGYWAFFGRTTANTPLGWRYWNAFGIRPGDLKKTMAVEINPPQAGVAEGIQGLFAREAGGQRWILHGGRLHIGRTRLASGKFAELSGLGRIPVTFSDGSERDYFLVAPLDRGADALHTALRSFVATCASVRNQVLYGNEDAEIENKVDLGEGQSSQEKRGDYVIPPRGKVIAKRIHADIWHALVKTLNSRKVGHTNARVGRWGPDLRTRGADPILFEIKTDTSARAIYEALGQLILYEQLVGKDHRKVLIVPGAVSTTFAPILAALEIAILEARRSGRSYAFPALNQLLTVAGH